MTVDGQQKPLRLVHCIAAPVIDGSNNLSSNQHLILSLFEACDGSASVPVADVIGWLDESHCRVSPIKSSSISFLFSFADLTVPILRIPFVSDLTPVDDEIYP